MFYVIFLLILAFHFVYNLVTPGTYDYNSDPKISKSNFVVFESDDGVRFQGTDKPYKLLNIPVLSAKGTVSFWMRYLGAPSARRLETRNFLKKKRITSLYTYDLKVEIYDDQSGINTVQPDYSTLSDLTYQSGHYMFDIGDSKK